MVEIEQTMRDYGCCLIYGLRVGNCFQAIEGSHRIYIAAQIGMTIDLEVVDPNFRIQEYGRILKAREVYEMDRSWVRPLSLYNVVHEEVQ